jgi:hypothetical protein
MSDRRRRQPWYRSRLTALLLAVALLGGCQAGTVAGSQRPAPTGGRHQPAPIRFAGRTSTTTRPFLLAGGLIVASAEHRGSGRFKVEVLNKDGHLQRVLFLATGRYRGSTGFGLRGGIYRLAISGATPWRVQIDQPRGLTAAALPQQYRGSSDALVGPFQAGGRLVVDVEHHGPGDISVELLSDSGASLYFLLEDSGPLRTSRAAQDLEAGGYYLRVEATRAWMLRLHGG